MSSRPKSATHTVLPGRRRTSLTSKSGMLVGVEELIVRSRVSHGTSTSAKATANSAAATNT